MQKTAVEKKSMPERLSSVATSYFFLAIGSRRNGKFDYFLQRSETLLGIALCMEPSSPVHRNNRALVLEARGDFKGAFLDFEEARKLCNGNGSLRAAVERNAANTVARLGIEREPIAETIQIGIYNDSHYS